ncbi:MAG: hypothetical protein DRO40_12880 [Thermoprotei archaeon]|nr:MAG: hypothetical protein DRO40_12880 [Thermoprotei archaeon]
MMPRIIADEETIEQFMYVTVNGRLKPKSSEDYMKLCLLAYRFKQTVKHGLDLVLKGIPQKEAYKELAKLLPSSIYGETAYKYAKLLVEGSNERKIKIRRIWVASRGGVTWRGNLNIRLVSTNRVLIRYYNGEWLEFSARFGRKYLPLIRELIELAKYKRISYGVSISFNNGKPYVHVEIPLWLYLKHFSTPKSEGYGLIAGFDLNSDRVNVVVINGEGDIVALKTFWYSDVVSHGFPREKARWLRLNALADALKWCRRIGVDYIVFEDLIKIKTRKFTSNPTINRKITRFPKKQMIRHGVMKALKLGFTVILVDPRGTSNSITHRQIMIEKGLDRHMASAHMIAYRGLKRLKEHIPSTTPPT